VLLRWLNKTFIKKYKTLKDITIKMVKIRFELGISLNWNFVAII